MGKNKKIRKRIAGLQKAREKHLQKKQDYKGKDEYVVLYWEKEIDRLNEEIREEKRKLGES